MKPLKWFLVLIIFAVLLNTLLVLLVYYSGNQASTIAKFNILTRDTEGKCVIGTVQKVPVKKRTYSRKTMYEHYSEKEYTHFVYKNCGMVHFNITCYGNNTRLPLCPCIKNILNSAENLRFVGWGSLNNSMDKKSSEYDLNLQFGGRWSPSNCLARHQVAIIIPFRDREQHLQVLLRTLHPLLQLQNLSYQIFVIEQEYPDIFNKAAMMNIGFLEARKQNDFDCYIFHDVDLIPEDGRNMYVCAQYPRHAGAYISKINYKIFYTEVFGGVTAFTEEQFIKANGFSNLYYGWGGEDDDMGNRVYAASMKIIRYPQSVGKYFVIEHERDNKNPIRYNNPIPYRIIDKLYEVDGVNSVEYDVIQREDRPLYSWILAKIPHQTKVKNLELWNKLRKHFKNKNEKYWWI